MSTSLALAETSALDSLSAKEEFLADCRLRGLSPKTVEWYKYALEPFIRFAFARGETDVDSVTEGTVRAFLSEQSAHVRPRRVDHYRQAITRFYKWLIAEGCTQENPAAHFKKIREPRRLVNTFNEAELEALLAQPDTGTFLGLRDHVFMLLLLDTGLRLSEALGLRLCDLDLHNGTMRVLGKGSKERLVGFSPVMEHHLRRYLTRREVALAGIGKADSVWLFPNQQGDKGGSKGYQMRLKRYGEAAAITRVRVSPHTFRHTFALWFVRNGGSPFHLQKILGHASLDMSRRYCELANVDFLASQRELSPLAMTDLGARGRKRLR